MARRWHGGAELRTTGAGTEYTSSSGLTLATTGQRSGDRAWWVTTLSSGAAKYFRYQLGASAATGPFWWRVYIKFDTLPGAENYFIVFNDTDALTTPLVYLTIDNSGVVRLYDEDGQITGTTTFSTGTYYRLEIKVSTAGGAGACIVEAKVDGAAAFASSSTRSLSGNFLNVSMGLNLALEANTSGDVYFDDCALNDDTGSFQNDYPGAGEIIIMLPDGNSGTPQWTRGGTDSGANWSQLDDYADAADYVESNTSGQVDEYTLAATPAAMASDDVINVVLAGCRFWLSSAAGSDPSFTWGIKSGSTNDNLTAAVTPNATSARTNNTNGSHVNYPALANDSNYQVPGTATAWTKSDLDSAIFHLEETATETDLVRVGSVWLMVDHKPFSAYLQSVSGTLTTAGALVNRTGKALAGTLTSAGALVKLTGKVLTGTLTSAGALAKLISRTLTGTLNSSATLSGVKIALQSISGTLTSAGTLAKNTGKSLAGTLTSAGVLVKLTSKAFTGTLTSAGTLAKRTMKALAATLTSSGTLAGVKTALKSISGTLTTAGALVKQTSKTFTGTLTSSGALTRSINKVLTGTLTLAGTLIKLVQRAVSGTLTLVGTLTTLATTVIAGIVDLTLNSRFAKAGTLWDRYAKASSLYKRFMKDANAKDKP